MQDAIGTDELKSAPDLLAAIEWLLDRTDKLHDLRNNVVHSAYALHHDIDGSTSVIPHTDYGNKRSRKLAKQLSCGELLGLLECIRSDSDKLSAYSQGLFGCIIDAQHPDLEPVSPMPERPTLSKALT